MKPKDVNFIQLHIEKLILAVAALIVLAIVFFYFIGTPYQAKVRGQALSVDEVPPEVAKHAQTLSGKLSDTETELPKIIIGDYTSSFKERIDRSPLKLAGGSFSMPLEQMGTELKIVEIDRPPYTLLSPPAAIETVARDGYGVIAPMSNPELQSQISALIGESSTGDFRYVTVGATFDLDAWTERLRTVREGEEAIPEGWWRSTMFVGGVYLERQELDRRTGEWGPTEVIEPMPGQLAFMPAKPGESLPEYSQQQADYVEKLVKDSQEQIVRPVFVPMVEPAVWLPPDSKIGQLSPEENTRLAKLRDQIRSLQRRIEVAEQTLERQLERSRNQPTGNRRQPVRQQTGSPRGISDYDIGPRGAAGQRGSATRPRAAGNNQSREQQLQEQISRLQEELYEKQRERDDLLGIEEDAVAQRDRRRFEGGLGPEGMMYDYDFGLGADPRFYVPGGPAGPDAYRPGGAPGQYGRAATPRGGAAQPDQPEEEIKNTIKVWAHDLTAKPGKTYRYRLIVAVLNPLFRQTRVEDEQKEENYNRFVLVPDEEELAGSEWSKPVELDPEYHFFLVSGNPQQGVGTVEVWRIHKGQWHFEEFDIRPGDPVGGDMTIDIRGEPVNLDMRVDTLAVDLFSTGGSNGLGSGGGVNLLYTDPDTGELATRSADEDRDSATRIRLKNEAATMDEMLSSLSVAN